MTKKEWEETLKLDRLLKLFLWEQCCSNILRAEKDFYKPVVVLTKKKKKKVEDDCLNSVYDNKENVWEFFVFWCRTEEKIFCVRQMC